MTSNVGGSVEVALRNILAELRPEARIAVVKAGGIGDFLAATPGLRALRHSAPQAHITLITSAVLAPLGRRYSTIDRVVVAPPYRGVIDGTPHEGTQNRFFAQIQGESFDLALQWHGGGPNSNPFVRRLGARLTAGMRGKDAPELDISFPYDLHQHEVMRYLDLVVLLGGRPDGYHTELPLLPQDFDDLARLGGEIELEALDRYVGVNVSAGGASRCWPGDRFAAVVDALLDEQDLQGAVITAGPGQEALADAVLAASRRPERMVNLAGRTTLAALVGLISRVRLYISNDSGPAHMAQALGTPTVVVFGSGNPLNWAPLQRTWYRPVAVLNTPCRWMERDGCSDTPHVPCLQAVEAEWVLGEARGLLAQIERLR